MIVTFALGVLAVLLVDRAEPHVKRGLENVLMSELRFTGGELRLATLVVSLLAAAVLAKLFGNGGALSLMVGACVGLMLPKIAGGRLPGARR